MALKDLGGLGDQAKKLVDEHGDKIAEGTDKATDAIDKKTGGKHRDNLEKLDDLAKNLDKSDDRGEAAS